MLYGMVLGVICILGIVWILDKPNKKKFWDLLELLELA
jgi:hypothetical protein